jgi:hypothetical protein
MVWANLKQSNDDEVNIGKPMELLKQVFGQKCNHGVPCCADKIASKLALLISKRIIDMNFAERSLQIFSREYRLEKVKL